MQVAIFNHPIFGEMRLSVEEHEKISFMKLQQHLVYQWRNFYHNNQKIKQFKHLFVPLKIIDESGPQNQIKITYHYYPVCLRDQIINRSRTGKYFTKSQIFFILNRIVKGIIEWKQQMKILDLNESTYRAISSDHILLNQNGEVKLIIPASSPINYPSKIYYPPQDELQTKKKGVSIDVMASLAFSIGMILTQLMLLRLGDSFYDYRSGVKYAELMRWLQNVKTQYGEIWKLTILMLKLQTSERIKVQQIDAFLLPYEKQIDECNEFTFDPQLCYWSLKKYLNQSHYGQ